MLLSQKQASKWRPAAVALPAWLLVALTLLVQLQTRAVGGEPSQQSASGQRSAGALTSNEISQDSDGLAALGAYGRGAYVNSKRARKMSAFMPMRGRKDGRDQPARRRERVASMLDAMPFNYHFGRELDSPPLSELSLLRLMAGNGGGALRGSSVGATQTESRNPNQAMPRQFVDQLEQIGEQFAAAAAARRRATNGGSGGGSAGFAGATNDNQELVETKYRRAFHPMRGKKSDANFEFASLIDANGGDGDASEGAAAAEELQGFEAPFEPLVV